MTATKAWRVNHTVTWPLKQEQLNTTITIFCPEDQIQQRLETLYPYDPNFFPDPSPRQIVVNEVTEILT